MSAVPVRATRRGIVLFLVVMATLVILVGVALACVPQKGDLAVENLTNTLNSQDGVITGDGSTTPLEWCELLGPTDNAEAEEGDTIRVTVSEATQHNGCPDTGDDTKLPEGTYQIWVSNNGAEWGWSTTDHGDPNKWSIPKGLEQVNNNEEPYGCFWGDTHEPNVDPRTHDQSQTINVDSNGDGQATFDLDLSISANSDPNTWTPEVNDQNWAAVLCIGNPEVENSIGIFAPLQVTALNSTSL